MPKESGEKYHFCVASGSPKAQMVQMAVVCNGDLWFSKKKTFIQNSQQAIFLTDFLVNVH